jgi:hypothetical protein
MHYPLIGVLSLLLALPLIHAQAVASPTGCPAPVGVQNGNFDSGQFAPVSVTMIFLQTSNSISHFSGHAIYNLKYS